MSSNPAEQPLLYEVPLLWGAFDSSSNFQPVLALSHHAATARWMSTDRQWSEIAKDVTSNHDRVAEKISALARSLLATDAKLREAALSGPSNNALLDAAFALAVTGKKANHLEFFIQLAQGLLLDRMVWLRSSSLGTQSSPSAHRWASLPSDQRDRRLKPRQEALGMWPSLVRHFLELASRVAASRWSPPIAAGDGVIAPHLLQKGLFVAVDNAAADLLDASLDSDDKQLWMAIKGNILDAAIGAGALLMVR